jgi:hypothetical protein
MRKLDRRIRLRGRWHTMQVADARLWNARLVCDWLLRSEASQLHHQLPRWTDVSEALDQSVCERELHRLRAGDRHLSVASKKDSLTMLAFALITGP